MNFNIENRRSSAISGLKPMREITKPVTVHYEIHHYTSRMQKLSKTFKVYRLTVLTLICLVAGIVIGLICRPHAQKWSDRQFMYIEMPGELFLRLLRFLVIPFLVSNVILSFGTIQSKHSSRLAKVSSFLYISGNLIAITIGISVALILCPGKQIPTKLGYQENIAQPNVNRSSNLTVMQNLIIQSTNYIENISANNPSSNSAMDSMILSLQPPTHISSESPELEHQDIEAQRDQLVRKTTAEDLEDLEENNDISDSKMAVDVLLDVLRNLIPDNIIGAAIHQTKTKIYPPKGFYQGKNSSTDRSLWPVSREVVQQANIIGIIAISVLIGVLLSIMEDASKPILDICACIAELSLRAGMMTVNLAPFCIMFLLISQVAKSPELGAAAGNLVMYSITVIIALMIHGFLFLPLVYYMVTKKSPLDFLVKVLDALSASFATSSSSATMALMLNCLSEMDLNPIVVRAFGPLGSVFSMNGTAIYEAIAVLFIAQTLGVTLPPTSVLLVGLSSALASISTAGIPSSGLMTVVVVLNTVNLPIQHLSLIYVVDFIIDRFRTVVNVWSGAIVCGLINHFCPEHLFEEDMKPEKYLEMVKYRGSRSYCNNKKDQDVENSQKPQIISVTITPPTLESSSM